MSEQLVAAPEWAVEQWLNSSGSFKLSDFRGRVVMLHAFQMLCPGCVSHALPQAQRVWEYFDPKDVMVVGLHSVFEHHEAMTATALKAFVHEYRLTFPIAIDRPSDGEPLPTTMRTYGMQGTPTMILVDRIGRIRRHSFGRINDLDLGAELATLIRADTPPRESDLHKTEADMGGSSPECTSDYCGIDPQAVA